MSIQDSEGILHCGGAITTSNTVVTAAHCFIEKATNKKMTKSKIKSFKIVAGTDKPFSTYGELHIFVLQLSFEILELYKHSHEVLIF